MSKKNEHTPGPWHISLSSDWSIYGPTTAVEGTGGWQTRRVLTIRDGVIPTSEDERLLEAAPDLLAACERVDALVRRVFASRGWNAALDGSRDLGDVTEWIGPALHEAQDVARAAIARARGES